MNILRFAKNWTLPLAIMTGSAFYFMFARVPALQPAAAIFGPAFDVLFPLSVFFTLLATFSKVDFHHMRPARWQLVVSLLQILFAAIVVALVAVARLQGESRLLAEAALTCIIAPCASAAPVVTGKLGGNLHQMTLYVLLSSLMASVVIPLLFPLLERTADVGFFSAFLHILQRLFVVIILPLGLGWVVRHYVPPLYRFVVAHSDLPFYLWAFSLTITTGITVRNIVHAQASARLIGLIALGALAVCLVQFAAGRMVGRRSGHTVEAGQGLGQKNTAMAIWVTSVYLHPVASLGPGCYVLWQNLVNSYELWKKRRNDNTTLQKNS